MWYRKQIAGNTFLCKFLQFMTISGGPVSWKRIGNIKLFFGRVTILLSYQHFSSCAESKAFRNWLLEFFTVQQKSIFNFVQPRTFHFQIPTKSKCFPWAIGLELMSFQALQIIHCYKCWITACQLITNLDELNSSLLRPTELVFRVWLQTMEKRSAFNYMRLAHLHYLSKCAQPCKTHLWKA